VPRRRSAFLAAALALALAATACASRADDSDLGNGNSATGKAATTTTAPAAGRPAKPGAVSWRGCGLGAQCAVVEVPLDYAHPDGDTIPLSVTRVPARKKRIGALFVNPGGPGGTATDFAAEIASFGLPTEITDRFDIVGVDPRGLGASDINCHGDPHKLYGVDYSLDSPADTKALLDVSRAYIAGCRDHVGRMLPHLGTADDARDIDSVRAAMGDDKLSYLGFSYGTAIGQMLAQLHPERIRAMVLDGVVDLGESGLQLAVDQADGFEKALHDWAADCDADPSCPAGPDAMASINRLSAKVERAPIPAKPRDLGPGELATGMAQPLYVKDAWPDLSEAVAAGLKGDGTKMVALSDQYLSGSDSDVYFAVNCLDFAWPSDPNAVLAAGKEAAKKAPHFGEPIVNDYVRCPLWPVHGTPLPAVTAPGTPPIVVISTTNDPATPYQGGVDVAHRLKNGVLLTHKGEGHTSFAQGDSCVDDAVTTYLVDLTPPKNGATCD